MRINLLLLFSIFSGLLQQCKQDTTTKTNTVVQHDTVVVHDTVKIASMISDTVTTFIIVRHAEKEPTGTDPGLTADGQARAEELKRILEDVQVSRIYTTPFNRTRQTVSPLATAKSITPADYPADKPYSELVSMLISENRNKTAVVAGHSNTVPEILKAFNSSYSITISDSQYDNLFIVSVPDKQTPRITRMRYGKATP